MDNKGEGVIGAILALLVITITMAIILLSVGTFVDAFVIEMSSQTSSYSPYWQGLMDMPIKMFNWFYAVPIILIIGIAIWVFRVITSEVHYTYEEEEEWK